MRYFDAVTGLVGTLLALVGLLVLTAAYFGTDTSILLRVRRCLVRGLPPRGFDERLATRLAEIADPTDRARFAVDVGHRRQSVRRRSAGLHAAGALLGAGLALLLALRHVGLAGHDRVWAVVVVGLAGALVGQQCALAGDAVLARRSFERLPTAAAAVGELFALDRTNRPANRRVRDRARATARLERAFAGARIPVDELGLYRAAPLDSDAIWARLQALAGVRLARAYCGDYAPDEVSSQVGWTARARHALPTAAVVVGIVGGTVAAASAVVTTLRAL